MIFCVDFDGTCVEHMYPVVGLDAPGASKVLKRIVDEGHKIVLWTMRSGEELDDAVRWFNRYDIPLFGIYTHPRFDITINIDDAGIGCPLRPGIQGNKPMVDWLAMEEIIFPIEPEHVRKISVSEQ